MTGDRRGPTRRGLLTGGAALALAAAGGGALWAVEHGASAPPPGPTYLPASLPPAVRTAADVVVYGGTPAGVAAAVAARRLGRSVALVVLGDQVGGMLSGGLSAVDHGFGGDEHLGGLARAYFRAVDRHYGRTGGWTAEPHVAEAVLGRMLDTAGVRVYRRRPLSSADRTGARVTALRTLDGSRFTGRTFVDASYEGDLMAAAGVEHAVGREPRSAYGEALAGAQFADGPQSFHARLDPYRRAGDPGSGLLPGRWTPTPPAAGTGDARVQAYGFRLCLRIEPSGPPLPFTRPAGYDAGRYALLARYIRDGVWDALSGHTPIPAGKADLNSNGGFSTDDVGNADGWAAASPSARQRIFAEHLAYQRGLLWFLAQDVSVPDRIRHRVQQFGLAPDEFLSTGGWPPQLYVREARRLRSDLVLTQAHAFGRAGVERPVAYGFYPVDAHPAARTVVAGAATNEGTLFAHVPGPYRIPYGALVPARSSVDNLLVPVGLSASHVAFCSVRVEPTFLALGQAAGAAAALAAHADVAVQDVPYGDLRSALAASGQVV